MSDQNKCKLRNLYIELEVVIIDEISMMSNEMLLSVHKRLRETFGCSEANALNGSFFRRSFAIIISKITTGFCTIRVFISDNV